MSAYKESAYIVIIKLMTHYCLAVIQAYYTLTTLRVTIVKAHLELMFEICNFWQILINICHPKKYILST